MAKIGVIGWYNKRNAGDESYKISFPNVFPEHTFEFSEKITEADAYILGGGDIVCESFLKEFAQIDKPKHIMSVSLGNNLNTEILTKFNNIIVRDFHSLDNANNARLQAILCPDFAFALSPNLENGINILNKTFSDEGIEKYTTVIGVIINSHLYHQHDSSYRSIIEFEKLKQEISWAIDRVNASFLFIPFGKRMPWDDRNSNSSVMSVCKFWNKNTSILENLDPQSTLDVISACDMIISTRLHSSIFSCVAGTPFIDLIHNHKNKAFLNTINKIEYGLPIKILSGEVLKEKIVKTLENKDTIRKELLYLNSKYKQELKEVSKNVCLL